VLNSELHDELPALHDSRILFLVTNMQTLFAAEEVFHSETGKVRDSFFIFRDIKFFVPFLYSVGAFVFFFWDQIFAFFGTQAFFEDKAQILFFLPVFALSKMPSVELW
jgi:hypothetical protein